MVSPVSKRRRRMGGMFGLFSFTWWAKQNNLGQETILKLTENDCANLDTLLNLTEDAVKTLGLKVGARRTLLIALVDLRQQYKDYTPNGNSGLTRSTGKSNGSFPISKVDMRNTAKLIASGSRNGLGVYQLQPKLIFSTNPGKGNGAQDIRKYELGPKTDSKDHKVIMIVGATGSGKTTLINGMVNYLFGLDWDDNYRYKLIHEREELGQGNQAKSQTKWISSYTLYHQNGFKVPFSLTIIDTPGFGDTNGPIKDEVITQQIKSFLMFQGPEGISHVDAIGFVIQSSLPRLTPTQCYVFDQILALFGKDIGETIHLMLTFADGKEPQVLSGVKEAQIPYSSYVKFNNSSLFASNNNIQNGSGECDENYFDEMSWDMGMSSYEVAMDKLTQSEPVSLNQTKEVLAVRESLEKLMHDINVNVQNGLAKLEQLKTEAEVLKKLYAELDQTKNYNHTVQEEHVEKVALPPGTHVTNCLNCNRTCHSRCDIKKDEERRRCDAMDSSGYCKICVKRCAWHVHAGFPYEFVVKMVPVTKTTQELYQRYQVASREIAAKESTAQAIAKEFETSHGQIFGLVASANSSLGRLKEIALKPSATSSLAYLDTVIESEKAEAKPGFQERIAHYREIQSKIEYLDAINRGVFNPFGEYKTEINRERFKGSQSVWGIAAKWLPSLINIAKASTTARHAKPNQCATH